MKTSNLGISLIKHYESLHDGDLKKIGLQPKMCPAGIWTVGYGHALRDLNGQWLKGISGYNRLLELYPDLETLTEAEADDILIDDLEIFENAINKILSQLAQHEFDAIISFCFNCGVGNFKSSTLLRRLKGERGSIMDAWYMWNKSGSKILRGLQLRRESEYILYSDGVLNFKKQVN